MTWMNYRKGMSNLGNALGLSCAVIGAAVGGIVTEKAVIDQGTHVPLGLAVGVVMTAVGLSIPLARKFQKIFDELQIVKGVVMNLENRMDQLPCIHPSCPSDSKSRHKETGISFDDDPAQ